MKRSSKSSNKIVIKIGSSLLTGGGSSLLQDNLSRIVNHIAGFINEGKSVIVVTSGAIACGLSVLGLKKKPKGLPELQAAAAAGQNILMYVYSEELAKHDLRCAQILLTRDDFNEHKRYLNARNTINTLLDMSVIPIINENDAVSVEEIKFGDNDTLSASVAAAVEADGLLILTDIDGLYDSFNSKAKSLGKLIREVKKITPEIEDCACGTDKESCVGGMSTKIEAARIATNVGIPVILANGLKESLKVDFSRASGDGTLFSVPSNYRLSLKKRWIAFGAASSGKVYVDKGARDALVMNCGSLLAPGITGVDGNFVSGDIVDIVDSEDKVFAKGKINFSFVELNEAKGKKNKLEVVHRDNLVILG